MVYLSQKERSWKRWAFPDGERTKFLAEINQFHHFGPEKRWQAGPAAPGVGCIGGRFLVSVSAQEFSSHASHAVLAAGRFLGALRPCERCRGERTHRPEKTPPPLFNGKDLRGLSTWLKDTKGDDPA